MNDERAILRIALFSDSALPIINGVSVSVDRLRCELIRMGHQVTLFAPLHPEAVMDEKGVVRLKSWATPFAPAYPFALPAQKSSRASFDLDGFDLVHVHTPFMAGLLGIKWANDWGIPVVGSFHTDYRRCLAHCGWPLKWGGSVAAQFVRCAFGSCALNIVPSETAGKWLDRYGVLSPKKVVPSGAPLARPLDRTTLRRAFGWKEGELIVLSVGRLAPEKNPESLFHAFSLSAGSRSHARLVLVGDGPFRGRLERLSRQLGLEGRVTFLGKRPPSEASAACAAADVFVLPSFNETQGLALAEAMSWGLPVVAVRGGAACDGFIDGVEGFAVTPQPASIAAAVTSLLQDASLRRTMGRAAQAKARSWTSLAHAKAIEAAYYEVLGRNGACLSASVEEAASEVV